MAERQQDLGHGERDNQFLFRITVSPVIDGADPSKEQKYRPPGRAINPRAQLIERIHLYEGSIKTRTLGDKTIQVQGFMDISQTFFPDREITNQPFISWGLRDASTYLRIWGYSDNGISCDPIYAFRFTRILEELPEISDNSETHIDDFVSAATSAEKVLNRYDFEDEGKEELIRRRKKIATLIGHNKLREIMRVLPPRLEDMMQVMYDKKRWVNTKNLERELKLNRLKPSEFYLDAINAYNKVLKDLAAGLEKTGGAW